MTRCDACGAVNGRQRFCGNCGVRLATSSDGPVGADRAWAEAETGAGGGRPHEWTDPASLSSGDRPGPVDDGWGQAETGAVPAYRPEPEHDDGARPDTGGPPSAERSDPVPDAGAPGDRSDRSAERRHEDPAPPTQPTRAVGATAASGWTPPRTWEAPASRGWPGEAYAPRQPMRLSDETAARSARVRSAWLVAVTVTVTAILVASLLTFAWPIRDGGTTPTAAPRPSPSPTTPRNSGTGGRQSVRPVAPKALAAAKEIDKLLARSAAQRSTLQRAVTCRRSAAAAVRDLEEVYDGRRRLLEQVGDADFAPLPDGEHLQHHLRKAWELSMYADANFLEWATYRVRTPRPCTTATESYEAGLIQSAAAQRHKRKFIEQWEKTVRRPMGLAAVRTETDM